MKCPNCQSNKIGNSRVYAAMRAVNNVRKSHIYALRTMRLYLAPYDGRCFAPQDVKRPDCRLNDDWQRAGAFARGSERSSAVALLRSKTSNAVGSVDRSSKTVIVEENRTITLQQCDRLPFVPQSV